MNRRFILLALLVLSFVWSSGQGYQVQSNYFVYLQIEPAQPFYIRINGQKITANASGYLILPQLRDGDYKLIVGFPEGKTPEQAFNFRIDSKDKGYLIKDYGEEGWGLFDLQTMAVQKALTGEEAEAAIKGRRPVQQVPPTRPSTTTPTTTPVANQTPPVSTAHEKQSEPAEDVSDFTKILSQAANDPSLLEKPKEEPEEAPVVAEAKPAEEQTSNVGLPSAPVSSGEGVTLVYDDRDEFGKVDPITIFIPAPATSQGASAANTQAPSSENTENKAPAQEAPNAGNVLSATANQPAPQTEVAAQPEVVKPTNAACKAVAGEDDFLKLRRVMAAETNDDSMIAQAVKAFKAKCYTTAQIKYLSSMFLSNAGKYNFYAAAYAYVADRENFASLASEIKEPSYIEKFNSLLQ